MFQRAVRFGEAIYRSHEAVSIEHTRERTVVHTLSYEMQDGTGQALDMWFIHDADDALGFDAAEEWLQTIEEFAEVSDPAQDALDQVLDVLTDEQAEGIPDVFPAWVVDTAYSAGDRRRHGGILYKCAQPHTSQEGWEPPNVPALWTRIGEPGEEWPEWVQPVGAQDAYSAGDKVSHVDKHWTSDVDNNVWEPGVYGWTEVA